MRFIVTMLMHLLVASSLTAGPIESRIVTSTLTLPQSLEANSSSWCTWGSCTIGPRLYLASRSNGNYLVGWTDNFGNGHVSTVSGSSITSTHNFAGNRVRGLVAHDDGSYAVLLKNGATLSLSKRAADGSETWTTNLNSTIAQDSSPRIHHRLAVIVWLMVGGSTPRIGRFTESRGCTTDTRATSSPLSTTQV